MPSSSTIEKILNIVEIRKVETYNICTIEKYTNSCEYGFQTILHKNWNSNKSIIRQFEKSTQEKIQQQSHSTRNEDIGSISNRLAKTKGKSQRKFTLLLDNYWNRWRKKGKKILE